MFVLTMGPPAIQSKGCLHNDSVVVLDIRHPGMTGGKWEDFTGYTPLYNM